MNIALQVIDAMEDMQDCQREHLSRKLACTLHSAILSSRAKHDRPQDNHEKSKDTPFEPEWKGFVTPEISNTMPLPARIYANRRPVQIIFLQSDEVCETNYADRKGKYQSQQGIVLPKLSGRGQPLTESSADVNLW